MQQEYTISSKIAFYRKKGQLEKALEVTGEAIRQFPDSNFFYKILGDLSLEKKDYETAGNAYVLFLVKINGEISYFKNFVKFWKKYRTVAGEKQVRQVYDGIIERFNGTDFSEELKRNITSVLFDLYPEENKIFQEVGKNPSTVTKWVEMQEKEENQWNIYRFLYWESDYGIHTKTYLQRVQRLIAIMERYELYVLALRVTEKMLDCVTDEVTVRTLFRLCRKMGDYTKADEYIKCHPDVLNRDGFNIQYEFVYYYLDRNDETNLLSTLKKIKNSAESSIPISRTLQNFYVKLGMIDDAVEMRKHIAKLQQEKYGEHIAAGKEKGAQEERETEEAFWDTIKDMVSEQEHNRQLIAIKELLRGFSHELGQPITNIRYGVQLYCMKMERGLDSKEGLENLLADILIQTIRIKRLLQRFSPVVSGRSVNTMFNCISHVKSVFQDMQMRLESVGVEAKVEGIPNFTVYGDSVQFEQVIYNLVSNSIDELREKDGDKRITVMCQEQDGMLVMRFQDNGRGIPKEDANRIFNPFYSTKDKEKSDGGEGLGLYIVWNILKMYGGKIKVNLEYQDGAEFLIQIPAGGNGNV